jgi:hypothetical protein
MTANQWNARHQPGTPVRVNRGSPCRPCSGRQGNRACPNCRGTGRDHAVSRTAGPAWEVAGCALVRIVGLSGAVPLDACEAVAE